MRAPGSIRWMVMGAPGCRAMPRAVVTARSAAVKPRRSADRRRQAPEALGDDLVRAVERVEGEAVLAHQPLGALLAIDDREHQRALPAGGAHLVDRRQRRAAGGAHVVD